MKESHNKHNGGKITEGHAPHLSKMNDILITYHDNACNDMMQ